MQCGYFCSILKSTHAYGTKMHEGNHIWTSFLYVTFGCTILVGSLTIGTFLFILKPLNAYH